MARHLETTDMNKCLGCFTCMAMCSAANKHMHSLSKSAIKIRTVGGMSTRFIAVNCLACHDDPACASACPSNALTPREGGGVILDEKKCIGCRQCQEACSARAVNFDEDLGVPIICHHCGICARFCPHGCLQMVKED
jgi:Fe-S-cluster-containing dehydrogenase component